MGRFIKPARIPAGGLEDIQAMSYDVAQTFKIGALLIVNANGEVIECSADPTAVTGVSLAAANSGPGYDASNSPSVITGRERVVSVAKANRQTVFSMRGVNGATDPSTPLLTNIGEQYGVLKTGDDWVLDLAEVTVKVFEVTDIDVDNLVFFGKFLQSVISA